MLKDKVILVVGGGVIARGSVDVLAKAGASIVIGDIRLEEAQGIAADVKKHGVDSEAVRIDLGDPSTVGRAVETAMTRFGRIDGLYLNGSDADAALQDFDLLTVQPEIWERALRINLTGYFHAIRAALPEMLKAGRGSIVCTSSDDAFQGAPTRVGYATSKAAMLAMMRHVASRWGREGIRCNAICPGLIPHPTLKGVSQEDMEKFYNAFLEKTPATRLGRPQDIGAMVRLLMSDEGEWINGQAISVDGGLVMR
jgi:NAD(P)-dependent dehydrogenase (short-subunit alcohol dehydrogenase family)